MKQKFITYHPSRIFFQFEDGQQIEAPIAGVWGWNGRKYQVIDTGDDIKALQLKHSIPDELVFNETTDIALDGTVFKNPKS